MIESALFTELRNDTQVGSLVGAATLARIYPSFIPQQTPGGDPQYPAVVYSVLAEQHDKLYCGTSRLVKATVSIDSYAPTVVAARELSNAIRSLMIDYRGQMGGTLVVRDVSLESSIVLIDMEPGLFRVNDVYSIWYEEV